MTEVKYMTFNDTNSSQNYSTHSIFRYFGKLPPTLVSRLLDDNLSGNENFILELMCGSGTTLLETYLKNYKCVGVDVNPLSVLISNVKTTPIQQDVLAELLIRTKNFFSDSNNFNVGFNYFRPKTRNLNYWFTNEVQEKLSLIKYFIDNSSYYLGTLSKNNETALNNLLMVTFASIIRKSSNASTRTGRIFRLAEDNTSDPIERYLDKLKDNIIAISTLPHREFKQSILLADARNTGLADKQFSFILNHPPYFALYKYSSDVLRFELEWCNFDRRMIAKSEITDGFKTTDASLLNNYIEDMTGVFKEARRLLIDDGKLCVVVSDSTLREEQLPVIDRLIEGAYSIGLSLDEHFIRKVSFAQASYHRSANPNIKTDEDHVLYFKISK